MNGLLSILIIVSILTVFLVVPEMIGNLVTYIRDRIERRKFIRNWKRHNW